MLIHYQENNSYSRCHSNWRDHYQRHHQRHYHHQKEMKARTQKCPTRVHRKEIWVGSEIPTVHWDSGSYIQEMPTPNQYMKKQIQRTYHFEQTNHGESRRINIEFVTWLIHWIKGTRIKESWTHPPARREALSETRCMQAIKRINVSFKPTTELYISNNYDHHRH